MTDRKNGDFCMFKLEECGVNLIGFDDCDTIVYCNFCN